MSIILIPCSLMAIPCWLLLDKSVMGWAFAITTWSETYSHPAGNQYDSPCLSTLFNIWWPSKMCTHIYIYIYMKNNLNIHHMHIAIYKGNTQYHMFIDRRCFGGKSVLFLTASFGTYEAFPPKSLLFVFFGEAAKPCSWKTESLKALWHLARLSLRKQETRQLCINS